MPKKRPLDRIVEELHPSQRAGLEIGGESVEGSSPSSPAKSTAELISHMKDDKKQGRVPVATFVADDDASEFWSVGDDRVLAGVDRTFSKETIAAMQSGFICLRCGEPHEDAFPLACELCGYSMKELQVRDFALEVKGEKHLGPSKPIQEYQDELEIEHEKKVFASKIAGGKSRMKGLIRRGS